MQALALSVKNRQISLKLVRDENYSYFDEKAKKLECLSPASLSRLVQYLLVKSEPTRDAPRYCKLLTLLANIRLGLNTQTVFS